MDDLTSETPERFSLVAGGPFHGVLGRLGLLSADQVASARAALVLALIAWLPPTLLVLVQSWIDGDDSARGYFADLTVAGRFLIALGVLVSTEAYADRRFLMLTRHFRDARILPDQSRPAFLRALAIADRRSSSWVAESIILVFGLIWPGVTSSHAIEIAGSSWEGAMVGGEAVYSLAGAFVRWVSTPIFIFVVFRWMWRFLVWTMLLFRISRLPLDLAPMHPDRSAGLGFLAIYPSIFTGFIFALSCVVASSFLKELGLVAHAPETVWIAIGVWLTLNLVIFVGPLLVFITPIYAARERALLDYGRLAHHHHLAFHRRWILGEPDGEKLIGSPDASSASDLNSSVNAVREIRVIPIDLPAIVQLVVAAGLPMLAVVATLIPLGELVKWLVGTIL